MQRSKVEDQAINTGNGLGENTLCPWDTYPQLSSPLQLLQLTPLLCPCLNDRNPSERVFLPPILAHTKAPCMLLRDVLPTVQCRSFHTSESVVQMRDCISKPSVIGSYFLSSCVTPTSPHTHAYSLNSRILLVLFSPLPRDSQASLSSLQDTSTELLHDNCLPPLKVLLALYPCLYTEK